MSDFEKGGFIAKVIGPKRQWREYRARVKRLPPDYRAAVEAIQRYLMFFGSADGDSSGSMFEDLADLFERAADGTLSRGVRIRLGPAVGLSRHSCSGECGCAPCG